MLQERPHLVRQDRPEPLERRAQLLGRDARDHVPSFCCQEERQSFRKLELKRGKARNGDQIVSATRSALDRQAKPLAEELEILADLSLAHLVPRRQLPAGIPLRSLSEHHQKIDQSSDSITLAQALDDCRSTAHHEPTLSVDSSSIREAARVRKERPVSLPAEVECDRRTRQAE
jgi:hypothetical protein